MIQKPKWVHVKTTTEEREAWQAQAANARLTLADLMRERMNSPQFGREPPRRQRLTKDADPRLLAWLGRLNGNLNALAHWASSYKTAADTAQVLIALASIDGQLKTLLAGQKADHAD